MVVQQEVSSKQYALLQPPYIPYKGVCEGQAVADCCSHCLQVPCVPER